MKQNKPLIGVNLGGWLVLERWMTESVFKGTTAKDEYTFMQTSDAAAKIEKHRKSFITEADFAWLASNGVNAIRIPVGYWVFGDSAPYTAAIKHLDFAVKMAKKYNLKVLIDLHAAEGSQNGFDHSGKVGKADWYTNESYRERTVEVLAKLADRYKDEPTVWGLELLNEPKFKIFNGTLRTFYAKAYQAICSVGRPGLNVVFHDAFRPRTMSGSIKPIKNFPVVMDIHWYHFTFWLYKYIPVAYYTLVVKSRAQLLARLQRKQPVVIGEWSMVQAGNTLKGKSDADKKQLGKDYLDAQLLAYSNASGWFYWSYKTEGRGKWNFRSLVEDGTIILD